MPQEDPSGGPVFPRGRRKGGEALHRGLLPRQTAIWGLRKSSAPIPDIVLPRSEVLLGAGGAGPQNAPYLSLPLPRWTSASQEPMPGTGWRTKKDDGDGLPLTPAAPGPWRCPAPPPQAAGSPVCAPGSRRLPVAVPAAPAARRALRPAPLADPKLGPQRPAAAGGARWGPGKGEPRGAGAVPGLQ